jgi:hypothetical protein
MIYTLLGALPFGGGIVRLIQGIVAAISALLGYIGQALVLTFKNPVILTLIAIAWGTGLYHGILFMGHKYRALRDHNVAANKIDEGKANAAIRAREAAKALSLLAPKTVQPYNLPDVGRPEIAAVPVVTQPVSVVALPVDAGKPATVLRLRNKPKPERDVFSVKSVYGF